MQLFKCSLSLSLLAAALLLAVCHRSAAAPSLRVKRQDGELLILEDSNEDNLNPINAEEVLGADLERNKRKLPDATFEAKNAVLGFVFGQATAYIRRRRGLGGNSGADTAELDRAATSFELPDELFNKSFMTVTNISKTISRLIMNSARRYSRFVLFFKPVFGNALVVKGSEDPTTTTIAPTTTTTENAQLDRINEV